MRTESPGLVCVCLWSGANAGASYRGELGGEKGVWQVLPRRKGWLVSRDRRTGTEGTVKREKRGGMHTLFFFFSVIIITIKEKERHEVQKRTTKPKRQAGGGKCRTNRGESY